jgi:hypothetical protein
VLSGLARGPYLVNRIFAELFPDVGAFHMVSAEPSEVEFEGGSETTIVTWVTFTALPGTRSRTGENSR